MLERINQLDARIKSLRNERRELECRFIGMGAKTGLMSPHELQKAIHLKEKEIREYQTELKEKLQDLIDSL